MIRIKAAVVARMQSAVMTTDTAPLSARLGWEFDPALLRRHDRPGPRYTSYPTAPQFHDGFGLSLIHISEPTRPY